MSALLGVIERETELVRAAKVREAMALEPKKYELSRRYVGTIAHLHLSGGVSFLASCPTLKC